MRGRVDVNVKSVGSRADEALWVLERMRGCRQAPAPSYVCWLALTRSLCAAGRIDEGVNTSSHSMTHPLMTHPLINMTHPLIGHDTPSHRT